MKARFRIGDIVQLKSGGPPMTIDCISGPPLVRQIKCTWYDPDSANGVSTYTFREPMLKYHVNEKS